MKKLFYLVGLLMIANLVFVSCNNTTSDRDRGVVINGVRWATRNVDTPGTFTDSPESVGRLFNSYQARNACPPGWRVPTRAEAQSLKNAGSEYTTINGVRGHLFGSGRNQIFLPSLPMPNYWAGAYNLFLFFDRVGMENVSSHLSWVAYLRCVAE